MFPGRFFIAAGSGQLLNEGITGEPWPARDERNARLRECVDVMRALWRGEMVNHRGLVRVEQARLYTRPATPPLIVGAAVTAKTAAWVGKWADGLITVSRPPDQLREVVNAFRGGGGEGKPMFLKVQLSYARTDEEARRGAWEQWRTNVFPNRVLTELRAPADFDAAADLVGPGDLDESVRISADAERHAEW